MSSTRKESDRGLSSSPPSNMVVPIIDLTDIGLLLAEKHELSAGLYELVIQFKFGAGKLHDSNGDASAMAISFGGLGLRSAENENAHTIRVPQCREKAKPAKKSKPKA